MTRAVIATVAEDRPGIVSELSAIVHELGLNIEDSRMTVLGGEFAVLMSVAGADPALVSLKKRLDEQTTAGGFAFLFRVTGDSGPGREFYIVTVETMDHPGIVSSVTGFFSGRDINIRELSTTRERAPHTGTPVFNLTMEIEVSDEQSIGPLREAFLDFCADADLVGEFLAP